MWGGVGWGTVGLRGNCGMRGTEYVVWTLMGNIKAQDSRRSGTDPG